MAVIEDASTLPWVDTGGGNISENVLDYFQPAPYNTCDPEFPGEDANAAAINKYKKKLGEFTKDMLDCSENANMSGEILWNEVAKTFSHYALEHLSDVAIFRMFNLLRTKGVHIDGRRGKSRRMALWICLTAPEFPEDTQMESHRNIDQRASSRAPILSRDSGSSHSPQRASMTVRDPIEANRNGSSNARGNLIKAFNRKDQFSREWNE